MLRIAGGNWSNALRRDYQGVAVAVASDVAASCGCAFADVTVHALSVGSLVADVTYVPVVRSADGANASSGASPIDVDWTTNHLAATYQPFAAPGETIAVLSVRPHVALARRPIEVLLGLGITATFLAGFTAAGVAVLAGYGTTVLYRRMRRTTQADGAAPAPLKTPPAQLADVAEQAETLALLCRAARGREWSYRPNATPQPRRAALHTEPRVLLQLDDHVCRPGSASMTAASACAHATPRASVAGSTAANPLQSV